MKHGGDFLLLGVFLGTLGAMAIAGFIWLNWNYTDLGVVESNCTVINYTFSPPLVAWINVRDDNTRVVYVYMKLYDDATVSAEELYASQYPIGYSASCYTGNCDTCMYWNVKTGYTDLIVGGVFLAAGLGFIILALVCRQKNVRTDSNTTPRLAYDLPFTPSDSIHWV